jgi:Tfp pilus assembly protein PilW
VVSRIDRYGVVEAWGVVVMKFAAASVGSRTVKIDVCEAKSTDHYKVSCRDSRHQEHWYTSHMWLGRLGRGAL